MKRIVVLALLVCLCMGLCGCGRRDGAAILCVCQARPAAEALAAQGLSATLAASDLAALQQLDGGMCDYVLVTREGGAKAGGKAEPVVLSAFCILSRVGALSKWDADTRVVILGQAGGYGDELAQQVLTCALYGSVHYLDEKEALRALKKGTADVVMGMIAPGSDAVGGLLKKNKGMSLEPMPEGLLNLRLPDASMEDYPLTLGGQTAQTYALMGALVCGPGAEEETAQAVRAAVQAAGLAE